MRSVSLFYPAGKKREYAELKEVTFHDLGGEELADALPGKEAERNIIKRYMCHFVGDAEIAEYRSGVFDDIMKFPQLRSGLTELLDRIDFLKTYGSFSKVSDASGVWELMHRLDEMRDYIDTVESMYKLLTETPITSQGFKELRDFTGEIYNGDGFSKLKEDIYALKADVRNLKSVTLGINLNERFEAESIGIVSINKKPFTRADIISNFAGYIMNKDTVNEDCDWNEDYGYRPAKGDELKRLFQAAVNFKASMNSELYAFAFARSVSGEPAEGVMQYMDSIANQLLNKSVKKLKAVLTGTTELDINTLSGMIPELMFYVRWAEYIEQLMGLGLKFSKPVVSSDTAMEAKGFYNMKLATAAVKEPSRVSTIVPNDLVFDRKRTIYILTGANRGGKTTLTQGIGMLFLMAQAGLYVPAESFTYRPADMIFTHFPADEDKTMDLGRLGEECSRFKEIYGEATGDSLILLNETFSTTSFEEGCYIAHDAVRALRRKGARTIYNTHMHKLGLEIGDFNSEPAAGEVASLRMVNDGKERSYKVIEAPPEGMSYARDIAEKYGVTFEALTGNEN